MARAKKPEAAVMEFFENAPIESVEVMYAVVQVIYKRRTKTTSVNRKPAVKKAVAGASVQNEGQVT